jgi:pre-mRNA-splicing factor SPF27
VKLGFFYPSKLKRRTNFELLHHHHNHVNTSPTFLLTLYIPSFPTKLTIFIDYDPPLTDSQQDQIDDLITASLPPTTHPHPFLSTLPSPPVPTPFWSQEYARLTHSQPLSAIDLTKYQLSPTDVKSNIVAAEYLAGRADNLALLETYGSNAWLIGNAVQEQALGVLEGELVGLKEEGTRVNRERKRGNLEVGGEIEKLEGRWRKALRGIVEVEIACVGLEEEIKQLEAQQSRS